MTLTFLIIAASLLAIRLLVFLFANGLLWNLLRVCQCRRFATDCGTPDDVCTACGRDLPQEPVAARPHFRSAKHIGKSRLPTGQQRSQSWSECGNVQKRKSRRCQAIIFLGRISPVPVKSSHSRLLLSLL